MGAAVTDKRCILLSYFNLDTFRARLQINRYLKHIKWVFVIISEQLVIKV